MNVRTLRDSVSPKVALWLTLSAALVAVALVVSCGDDDCPACPTDKPAPVYKGWVYFAMDGDNGGIFPRPSPIILTDLV
jgi:hypothetical protein